MVPAKRAAPKPAFYEFGAAYSERGPGLVVMNWKDRPGEWPDNPRLLFDKKQGYLPPHDVEEMAGAFAISAAMKGVLQAADPGGCAFIRCETVLPSGEAARETWICFVTRTLPGAEIIDFAATKSLQAYKNPNGSLRYSVAPDRVHFKPELIGSAALFHVAEMGGDVFCNQAIKDACKTAGIKGTRFRRTGEDEKPPDWWVAHHRRAVKKAMAENNSIKLGFFNLNLAEALVTLGKHWSDTSPITEAVALYRAELMANRGFGSGQFALMHNALGNALLARGELDKSASDLAEAIEVFRKVSEMAIASPTYGLRMQRASAETAVLRVEAVLRRWRAEG